jgi:hypothetical protein
MNLGDRVRVKSEPELGVVVIRALWAGESWDEHSWEGADVVPPGHKSHHARSFFLSDLEAAE